MKYVSKDNLKQTVKAIKSYINTDRLKELDKFEDGAIVVGFATKNDNSLTTLANNKIFECADKPVIFNPNLQESNESYAIFVLVPTDHKPVSKIKCLGLTFYLDIDFQEETAENGYKLYKTDYFVNWVNEPIEIYF